MHISQNGYLTFGMRPDERLQSANSGRSSHSSESPEADRHLRHVGRAMDAHSESAPHVDFRHIRSSYTKAPLSGDLMKRPGFRPILLLLLLPGLAPAQTRQPTPYPAMAAVERYRIADLQEEIALARTAAPRSISADAEVLVLGKHGYETGVRGRNGFVCFVERSWAAGFGDAEFWNPKLRAPNCFNPPAVRSVLPQYLQRTEWALAGIGREEMIEKARVAFASRRFTAPEAGSLSFMLSKQGYLSDDAAGPWLPHVMFFVPHGEAVPWGAGLEASPILGADGSAFEPTVLLIPVRRWSDGSPAPSPATEHQHSP